MSDILCKIPILLLKPTIQQIFYFSGDSLGNTSAPSGQPLLSVDDASNTTLTNSMTSRQSPPKAVVDSSPLQAQMDKNKECKYLHNFFYLGINLCK